MEPTTIPTTGIVQQATSELPTPSPLTSFQQEALKDAEAKMEQLQKDLENRKYLANASKEEIEVLRNFITYDAPWKFTEALGIIEVTKELNKCAKKR